MNYQKLKLTQVDSAIAEAKNASISFNKYNGYIKTIREALGMTTRQLAKRVKASQTSVTSAERNEISHKITLAQLDRFAEALGCKVIYSFVPETSLEEMVDARAEAIAKAQVGMVEHTMKLEDQNVKKSLSDIQMINIKRSILDGSWSKLWD